MLVYSLWLFVLLISSVNGKCTKRTCVFGQCRADKCLCQPGITGETCNVDIVDCDRQSCLNNGTCVEAVNGFLCDCLPDFEGPRCQSRLCSSKSPGLPCRAPEPFIANCSILKFHIDQSKTVCIAVGVAPTTDIQCQCEQDMDDKRSLRCQMTPWTLESGKCRFKKSISPFSSSSFSSLPDPIAIHVCPVDWKKLQSYKTGREHPTSLHNEECRLVKS